MIADTRIYKPDIDLGNEISKCVLEEFRAPKKLKDKLLNKLKNAKPRQGEFTVLAGIVSLKAKRSRVEPIVDLDQALINKRRKIGEDQLNIAPLTISTGLKAIPSEKINKMSSGRMIHDQHAEILSIRLFNHLLLTEMEKLQNQGSSDLLQKSDETDKFTLKDKSTKFALYVSEIPCGDASIENTKENNQDKTKWDQLKPADDVGVARGRENFDAVGIVRTKPGRKDSPVSYSKSCSDKLCLKMFTSLLSCTTYDLVIDPKLFYLSYIVLPNNKINETSIQRCFYDRFKSSISDDDGFISSCFKKITVLPTSLQFEHEKSDTIGSKSNNLSVVYSPYSSFLQVLNNGVKDGCPVKQTVKFNDQSELSRESLLYRRKRISDIGFVNNYKEFKNSSETRQLIKHRIKEALGGWGKSTIDELQLGENN